MVDPATQAITTDRLPGRTAVLRRAGWTVTDQALSSLGNFALGVVLARSLSPRAFGAFGLGFAVYLLVLGASRALGSSVLQVRFTTAPNSEQEAATRDSTGVPFLVAGAASVPLLVLAATLRPPVGPVLGALALALPGLLLQDAWRFAFFSQGRARSAALNDLAWLAVEIPLLALLVRSARLTGPSALLAWGVGAYAAGLVGVFQAGTRPSLSGGVRWLATHRDLGLPTLGEFLLLTGTWPATLLMAGGVLGLRGVATLRAAEILVGPLTILLTAAVLLAVPEGARLYESRPFLLPRVLHVGASAYALVAVVLGGAWLLLPSSLGRAVVGSNWEDARAVIVPLALHFAAVGLMAGSLTGLRILESAREALVTRAVLTPVYLVAALVGMLLGGPFGAAAGTAAASVIGAWMMLRVFRSCFARLDIGVTAESPGGDPRPTPTPRLAACRRRRRRGGPTPER